MRRCLFALAALLSLVACTPKAGNNTQSSAAVSSAAPPAGPMNVQQAAEAFGLIGVWAADCSQPAGPDSERATYALESDGTVSLTYDNGPDVQPNRYSWNQGMVIQPDEIQLDGIFYGDNQAQHTVLQKNDQGQIRVFGNVDGSGKMLVQNGAFPDGGGPPWENKCP